jgi:hypothetical protein
MQVNSNSGWIQATWKINLSEEDTEDYLIAVEFNSGYIGYWSDKTEDDMYALAAGGGTVFHNSGWYGGEIKPTPTGLPRHI